MVAHMKLFLEALATSLSASLPGSPVATRGAVEAAVGECAHLLSAPPPASAPAAPPPPAPPAPRALTITPQIAEALRAGKPVDVGDGLTLALAPELLPSAPAPAPAPAAPEAAPAPASEPAKAAEPAEAPAKDEAKEEPKAAAKDEAKGKSGK